MKIKPAVLISFLLMSFFALTSMNTLQDQSTFEGEYEGRQEYNYSFTGINAEGKAYSKTFHIVDASVLKMFNLNSSRMKGTKFSVTYTTKTGVNKDENGKDNVIEVLTIVALNKL